VQNGIVQLFNFQLSAWGARDFCVNVAAFTLCGNDQPVLQPGFRLRKSVGGGELWLPSGTAADAAYSLEIAWSEAVEQALPWFAANATLEGHLQTLNAAKWGSRHHQLFQIGVVEALLGLSEDAIDHLREAIALYLADGREWCNGYVAKAGALLDALRRNEALTLLDKWGRANTAVHRLKQPLSGE
jgi:tetratricopeptide (TPR) repeat protein